MKKILISILAILYLTSCGTPKIDNPTDGLKQNQEAVFENIETLMKYTPTQGNSKGIIKVGLNTKEADLQSEVKYDINFKQKEQQYDGNIKVNLDVDIKDKNIAPIEKLSGDIDLNLITLKNKLLFKLNKLNINDIEKNPQLAIITGIVAPFQEKWHFIDIPKDLYPELNQEVFIKNQKKIVKIFKKHTIFKFVKENINENFYDYDVELSSENIILVIKEINKLINEKELDKDYIISIKDIIKELNFGKTLNIKINKNNLELFIFSLINKDVEFTLENKEKEFNFSLETKDEGKVIFSGKKSASKIKAKIIGTIEENNILNADLIFEIDGKKAKMTFNGIVKNEGEEVKFNLEIDETITKKYVNIEEPKDAINFQEVIGNIMGGIVGGAIGNKEPIVELPEIKNKK